MKLPWEQKPPRIAVIGDIILDEYINGVVNRISPEAPVPVHLVTGTSLTAGGATNVARNVKLAGGEAIVFGVCGDDEGARALKAILQKDGIDVSHILTDPERPTIKKTRIVASSHQLVRIDWEKQHPLAEAMQDALYRSLQTAQADLIVLSDYGKGSLTPRFIQKIIAFAQDRSLPVLVDPKGKDYTRYRGATLITPNRKEACEALGLDPNEAWPKEMLAEKLREFYSLENVLVTLGSEGMYCLPADAATNAGIYLPAMAREVFDVSGAGDTVVALLGLALASGTPLAKAMHIANVGAGRVVEKWGTQPIYIDELKLALAESTPLQMRQFSTSSKIITREGLPAKLAAWRQNGKKICFTNGCFDILHGGHIAYLEEARSQADYLVIGINGDASITRLKGPERPIIPLAERMRLLAALACVDAVVSFDEDTPLALINELRPDVLVKGADWALDQIVGAKEVMANGGKVARIPYIEGLSTTAIIQKIRKSSSSQP